MSSNVKQQVIQKSDFFDHAFQGYTLPTEIRLFAEAFCLRFKVNGLCDPAYISNVVAVETQLGDGAGTFFMEARLPNPAGINNVGDRLLMSFATCISDAESDITGTIISAMLRDALNGAPIENLVPPPNAAPLLN